MKVVIQRVQRAEVRVQERVIGKIGAGLLIFLGVAAEDDENAVEQVAAKILDLRTFADADGKMNLSLREVGGRVLVVSQFTLCADLSSGKRPSFHKAMGHRRARELYGLFIDWWKNRGVEVAAGEFGADMQVELVNDGPVTYWFDSRSTDAKN